MNKLKDVTVTFIEGSDSSTIILTDVKRTTITERFLQIDYDGSKSFVLKLENLVYYTVN